MKYILPSYHRNVPEKELLNDIKRAARRLKRKTISIELYNKYGKYSGGTIRRRFGTWNKMLEKAGLEPSRNQKVPPEELFLNIKKVWDKLGRCPIRDDMKKPLSKYTVGAYTGCFGLWRKALEAFVVYANSSSKNKKAWVMKKVIPKRTRTIRAATKAMRYKVLERDKYKCRLCGSSPATNPKVKLHVDHIKPWSKGGETVIDNLQTLCEDCNLGKGAQSN
jgi:5-methylcytosine-specific restriction endonuclease McrA